MSVYINSCMMGEVLENWSKSEAAFHRRRPTFYRLIWFTYCLKIVNDVFPGLEMQSPQCWTVTLVALWRPKCFLRVTGLDELKFLQIEWRGLCSVPAGTGVGGAWVGESLQQVGGDASLPRAWSDRLYCRGPLELQHVHLPFICPSLALGTVFPCWPLSSCPGFH